MRSISMGSTHEMPRAYMHGGIYNTYKQLYTWYIHSTDHVTTHPTDGAPFYFNTLLACLQGVTSRLSMGSCRGGRLGVCAGVVQRCAIVVAIVWGTSATYQCGRVVGPVPSWHGWREACVKRCMVKEVWCMMGRSSVRG